MRIAAQCIGAVLGVLFMLIFPPDLAWGAKSAAQSQDVSTEKGFDIVLLMDCSGSMKKTDPMSYRKPAAKLFASLLGDDDRIGVIAFGDSAKVLLPLTPTTKKNRSTVFGSIERIHSKELSTNITDAVQKGFHELSRSQRKNRILILMSDGKLALGSKEKDDAAHAALVTLLPELSKAGVTLYSIAFTDLSDMRFLEDVARQAGGFSRLALKDKDIHVIFTSLFEKIKAPDSVPLVGETFSIDDDIAEAIVVISKKPKTTTVLIDPSGKHYTAKHSGNAVRWYASEVFDMMSISKPEVGTWKVKLDTKEGNKIFIITNLNLKSSFNENFIYTGRPIKITAWLEKDGKQLLHRDLLGQVTYTAEILFPNGKVVKYTLQDDHTAGDEIPGDGIYTHTENIIYPGVYIVKVSAEGKTFRRERIFEFKALEKPAPARAHYTPLSTSKKEVTVEVMPARGADIVTFGAINAVLVISIAAGLFMRRRASKRRLSDIERRKDDAEN